MNKTPPASDESATNETKQATQPPLWNEYIRTFIYAILLAVVFRSFVFEPFHIPSGSMKETLLVGDYLFVSKYSYGYSRYSFPYGIDWFDGRVLSSARPKRGDIVVFRPTSQPRIDFIKRIVGLPGDKIQVLDGIVYINDLPVSRVRDGDFSDILPDGTIKKIPRYRETLDNGVSYAVLEETTQGLLDDTYVYTVPEKNYFLMGDNRDNSADSREMSMVGFVPEENIVGRAELVLFSIDDRTSMWKIWDWFWALRTERLLKDL
ncbi:MAG: signal peptidase I [Alphaproteobacteria bacterium]|nr:MAG: signal peptidase I [Alphaproteobacteria bacterium]TAF40804.1 MAG: signal peptidase I [Alphaproteobacteria bacterium]TAF76655.1 MAG: signal peptidase I [Alphaproteobacteria bacterium]